MDRPLPAAHRHNRPTLREQGAYGVGAFGIALVQQTVTFFYLLFLTDTVGIAPATVGLLFVVARAFDAVTDPLVGYAIDRWTPFGRLGRLRPWLLLGAPLMAGALVLLFAAPGGSARMVLALVAAAYLLAGVAFDFAGMAFAALTPAMSQDPHQRSVLSSFRTTGAALGSLFLALGFSAVGEKLTGRGDAWFWAVSGVAGLALLALLLCGAGVRERVAFQNRERLTWRQAAAVLGQNQPLAILLVLTLGGNGAFAAGGASWIYYFRYAVGNEQLFGPATVVGIVAAILGAWSASLAARYGGKRRAMAIGLSLAVIARLWLYIIPAANIPLILINRLLQDAAFGMAAAMLFSMLADTVEYAQWQTGFRAEGVINGAQVFVTKLAVGIGAALPAVVLEWQGYVANADQTAAALQGIVANVSLVPALFLMVGLVALPFYRLTEERYAQVLAALQQKA